MQQMIAENEKDIAKLIDQMPMDILNLIKLVKSQYQQYQLFSHKHRVTKDYTESYEAGLTCQKVKSANKCLSGLDDMG